MSTENTGLNELDRTIIDMLQANASLTTSEIAQKIQLSPSATHERIRKLHSSGVIKKIAAFVQAAAVEKALCAFIYVIVDTPENSKIFLEKITECPEVMECHHITGEYSYLLKVRVKNSQQLECFITDSLKSKLRVIRTLTQIVLSSPKDGDTIID